jgi:hypothetical protein
MLVAFLSALYYTAVSFVTHDGIRLKQWFALVCWCLLPSALGAIAQLVHVLSSDARFLLQDEINPLSFGNLMGIKPTDAPIAQRIMLGLDPTSLWSVVLTVLGYQSWTGSSFARTLAIVLGPIVCIVGISAALTLS